MIRAIENRLKQYETSSPLNKEHALKEIIQEIALYGLWQAGFFEVAAFQGGTSLRILYNLPRFSEDLDFILKEPNPTFNWQPYLESLLQSIVQFGVSPEAVDKSRMDQRVKKALIKNQSIAQQLNIDFGGGSLGKKLKIKLEIDVEPPSGSQFDYQYLDFPSDFEICHQDLPSNFALKIHALLCRPYLKGRDWFDFAWYTREQVPVNLQLLKNALFQYGPWQSQALPHFGHTWLKDVLAEKIDTIKWSDATTDVTPFLFGQVSKSLELWSPRFFHSKLEKLRQSQ